MTEGCSSYSRWEQSEDQDRILINETNAPRKGRVREIGIYVWWVAVENDCGQSSLMDLFGKPNSSGRRQLSSSNTESRTKKHSRGRLGRMTVQRRRAPSCGCSRKLCPSTRFPPSGQSMCMASWHPGGGRVPMDYMILLAVRIRGHAL